MKTLFTALIALPVAWLVKRYTAANTQPFSASQVGLCVNIESALADKRSLTLQETIDCVTELGVQYLLVRVPLCAANRLNGYLELAEQFRGRQLLFDILQDRANVEDSTLLENHLRLLFKALSPYSSQFKIGNAVNRRKWAFNSLDEYFRFFKTAQQLRDREFPNLELLGGSIIDFELPNFARSLLHGYPVFFDAVAALLYVDRRGAPENTQLGASLAGKIGWFRAIMQLSGKTAQRLYITETNWPLKDTEPFAPAVGDCMVDENQQAAYLARYYLLCFATGQVEAVYWHQLVAPGYGLIDNRGDTLRKRKAYYALQTLAGLFKGSRVTGFEQQGKRYILTASNGKQHITAVWTNDVDESISIDALQVLNASSAPESIRIIDLTGQAVASRDGQLPIGGNVTYFIQSGGVA